jgi:hypothetical protein
MVKKIKNKAEFILHLKNAIKEINNEISNTQDNRKALVLKNALTHLLRIEAEVNSGDLTPKEQRYSYIGRLTLENSPSEFEPNLANLLIAVEQYYRRRI